MKTWRIFSRQTKFFITSIAVVLFLAVLQLTGFGGWLSFVFGWVPQPIVIPIRKTSQIARKAFVGIGRLKSLYVENAELNIRLRELELKLATLTAVESENQVLKNTLGFVVKPPSEQVACTVLSRDPDGLTQTLLLSCGSEQGIKVGQGVIAEGYLIGKVVLTNSKTSTARLLVSPSVAVDAKVLGRKVSGIVRGSFGSGIALDLIPATSGVVTGDLVSSAGVNDLIPPDLLIGTVSEIIRVPGALFDQISLSSPVDLRDLRFVGVIKE
jgi:rod shape-determining protein MreC